MSGNDASAIRAAYAQRLYTPDDAQVSSWVTLIAAGKITLAEVVHAILTSPNITTGPPVVPGIYRLAADAIALSVSPPSFQQLTADTLGNAATETDGFDVALQDIALALASESDGLSAMDSDLGEAGFVLGAFGSDNLDPVAADIGIAVTGGDAVMADLESSIGAGGQAVPTPVLPSFAPGGGGSGVNEHVFRLFPLTDPGDIITIDPFPIGDPIGIAPPPFPGPPPPPTEPPALVP